MPKSLPSAQILEKTSSSQCVCIGQLHYVGVFHDEFGEHNTHNINWPTFNNIWVNAWTECKHYQFFLGSQTNANIATNDDSISTFNTSVANLLLNMPKTMLPLANSQKLTKPCNQTSMPSCRNSNWSSTKWNKAMYMHQQCKIVSPHLFM